MTGLPPSGSASAGWYPDERMPGYYRWWDGVRWTEEVQSVQFVPPNAPPGPPEPPSLVPPPPPRYEQPAAPGYGSAYQASYAPASGYGSASAPGYGGAPAAGYGAPPASGNALAIWSLVLGILSVLMFWLPFIGLVLAAVALTLGVFGIRKAHAARSARGVAIAGTVIGGIMTLTGLIYSLSFAAYLASGGPSDNGLPVTQPSAVESPAPEEPDAEDTDTSAGDAAEFVADSRNDLEDFGKDLDDMIVTLDEDGFWRLLGNSIELSFNHAQLASRTPPSSIADEWTEQLAVLEGYITQMDEAIGDERYEDLRTIIGEAQDQLVVLGGILDQVEG